MIGLVSRAAVLAVTVLLSTVAIAGAAGATRAGDTQHRAAKRSCPVGALELPANGVDRAAKEALAEAASEYPTLKTAGAAVVSATRTTVAGPRGAQVARECGATARARTVIVELRFPRMAPSASLSEGVVDVSRFPNGYRVWAVAH
jgi:hypothetical protein